MRLVSAIAATVVALGISASANAAEIALLSPNPIKETLDQLIANYEKRPATMCRSLTAPV